MITNGKVAGVVPARRVTRIKTRSTRANAREIIDVKNLAGEII